MNTRRATLFIVLALGVSTPLAAQTRRPVSRPAAEPVIRLRPFFLVTAQQFTAKPTFDAVFGSPTAPFWGGGLQVAFRSGFFVDLTASRSNKTGQRAFVSEGKTYGLHIPLTVTETPFEVTAGYRFRLRTHRNVIPFIGGGLGSYTYTETSDFADASDNVETRGTGYVALGGVELRVHRWVGIAADLQYTYVTGILGMGGVSKEFGDTDLGGVAARVRVVVGR